ncbi:MAG: 1-phosphofructokinase family hexose kinase [Weeksellaceae bacterium]|nr:1-phosphofructokinase family hexose kinase [Weeksellaceae bacterium]
MTSSILTITLNPSVDKSSTVDKIIPEQKLRCTTPVYEPGGGGVNISRALKRLGVDAETIFLSGGRTGTLLEELLKKEMLTIKAFAVKGETRENFIVVDTSNQQQYRFGMDGDAVSEEEQAAFLIFLQELNFTPKIAVISGSLPPNVAPSYLKKIIANFKEKGSKVIVDTSGEALQAAAEESVFLLKPNIGELAALTGKQELDTQSAQAAAYELIKAKKAEVVVVSLGAKGAFLCSEKEQIWLHAPLIKVRSTVGAGDSMVAGMASVLLQNGTYKEMLQMGIACGSATTMATGTGLFKIEDVEFLKHLISHH